MANMDLKNKVVQFKNSDPDWNDKLFNDADLRRIESLAAGLSVNEVCALMYTTYEDLMPLDRQNFDAHYAAGKAAYVQYNVNMLRNTAITKEGLSAVLMVLQKFGEEWKDADVAYSKAADIIGRLRQR